MYVKKFFLIVLLPDEKAKKITIFLVWVYFAVLGTLQK